MVVREGELPTPPDEDFEDERHFRATPDEAYLSWRGVADFVVRGGREIVFQKVGDLEASWFRQFLLGPVIGVLLHQRGLLVLHGSAIEVDGNAFAIVGWKGQGKSTTAAGLHQRGYDLIADDIVAIDMTNPETPLVLPGIPQIKLWPDSIAAFGIDSGSMSLLHSELEKRAQRVTVTSEQSPKPLKSLYILDQGEAHRIETLPVMDAFSAIIQNAYAARFIGEAGIPPWHFRQCTALIQAVPVHRFTRKPSLALLPEALDMLEAHLKR
ncbi:MAG: hypothetical protein IIC22_09175 [Chloroflexi bacterium]|nr:hypothetical protein [Chloroflexota bacterium]